MPMQYVGCVSYICNVMAIFAHVMCQIGCSAPGNMIDASDFICGIYIYIYIYIYIHVPYIPIRYLVCHLYTIHNGLLCFWHIFGI